MKNVWYNKNIINKIGDICGLAEFIKYHCSKDEINDLSKMIEGGCK
ncbi:hypothetical protein [Klebsiella pneumoniae]|nr:hypothetical protein [Klebsiella pneumoniae]MDV5417911.1 hypothetical protein [Klebsiella pneumoniae]